jgi:hypothetical protein
MTELFPIPQSQKVPINSIHQRPDYIIEIGLQPIEYGKEEVQTVISQVKKVAGNRPMLLLIEAADRSTVTWSGIRALFSKESIAYSLGKAYVVHNWFHFLLAQCYLMVLQPITPLRFFRKKAPAETWLKSIIA